MQLEQSFISCSLPRVVGAKYGVEHLNAEDVAEEWKDGDHLKEEENACHERQHVVSGEVIQQVLHRNSATQYWYERLSTRLHTELRLLGE